MGEPTWGDSGPAPIAPHLPSGPEEIDKVFGSNEILPLDAATSQEFKAHTSISIRLEITWNHNVAISTNVGTQESCSHLKKKRFLYRKFHLPRQAVAVTGRPKAPHWHLWRAKIIEELVSLEKFHSASMCCWFFETKQEANKHRAHSFWSWPVDLWRPRSTKDLALQKQLMKKKEPKTSNSKLYHLPPPENIKSSKEHLNINSSCQCLPAILPHGVPIHVSRQWPRLDHTWKNDWATPQGSEKKLK